MLNSSLILSYMILIDFFLLFDSQRGKKEANIVETLTITTCPTDSKLITMINA